MTPPTPKWSVPSVSWAMLHHCVDILEADLGIEFRAATLSPAQLSLQATRALISLKQGLVLFSQSLHLSDKSVVLLQ